MKLVIKGDSMRLETMGKVALHLDGKQKSELGLSEGGDNFLLVENGPRKCVAKVESVTLCSGEETTGMLMDYVLRTNLKAKKGQEVSIGRITPSDASLVAFQLPPDWKARPDFILKRTVGMAVIRDQNIAIPLSSGELKTIRVFKTEPDRPVLIGRETRVECETAASPARTAGAASFASIGGLKTVIMKIRELIDFPLRFPETYLQLGIEPPRGIILYGPPGTGKTLIVRALTNELGANFFPIEGPEVISGIIGESERRLREVFEKARQSTPAVILIDELDAIAPRRESSREEMTQRLVTTLLAEMDGLSVLKDVIVVGTTNRLNTIDMALRRPGRFEHEIHVGIPNGEGRLEVLQIHTKRMPLDASVDLAAVAMSAHGFVGADIASLCREAARSALHRMFPIEQFESGQIPANIDVRVRQSDLEKALSTVQPSAMREVEVTIPRDVTLDSLGGLGSVKQLLRENIILSLEHPDKFSKAGIKPARGLLLYGPPGTGKTLLAKAIATESKLNFMMVRGPEIKSKWFGESEERLRGVFRKAREVAPCILLLDEIEGLASVESGAEHLTRSIVSQLLTEMDDIQHAGGVFVIGTTSHPDRLEPSLMRPGRFDYQIEVPVPDENSRAEIFAIHFKGRPISSGVSAKRLAAMTDGFSGSAIAEICREAVLLALRENWSKEAFEVTMEHFERTIHGFEKKLETLHGKGFGFRPTKRRI